MVHEQFTRKQLDEDFYNAYLKDRLPDRIIDFHTHIALEEDTRNISKDTIKNDWALQCASYMTMEQLKVYHTQLFRDQEVDFLALPFFCMGVDLDANNKYLSENTSHPMMAVDPSFSPERLEEVLIKQGFLGCKPYPAFVTNVKGAQISIFDFITHKQLEVLNKHKKMLMLHLPRKGRLPDDANIYELKLIKDRYPDIKTIIAHFGRSFCVSTLKRGLEKLGSDVNSFYYDTTAVINPDVFKEAFEKIDHARIMFGTDLPLTLWHGKRSWDEENETYTNLCREDFPWNKYIEGSEEESGYTFFIYEQLKNILDAALNDSQIVNSVFNNNAFKLMREA